MLTWTEFEKAAPEMASFGRERMGLRVMYIGTVRKDGYPRVHPFTPFVVSGRLFAFMEPTSPKGHDLKRDGRYAMHSQVNDVHGGGDEFALTGRARLVEAQATRSLAVSGCPYKPAERYILFEFQTEECFVNRYVGGETELRALEGAFLEELREVLPLSLDDLPFGARPPVCL